VVEANLRTGYAHPYHTRRFYIDEDSWQILAVDLRDEKGELVGLQESHPISYYELPMFNSTLETLYYLKTGNYFVDGLDNNEPMYGLNYVMSPRDFSPQALRIAGNWGAVEPLRCGGSCFLSAALGIAPAFADAGQPGWVQPRLVRIQPCRQHTLVMLIHLLDQIAGGRAVAIELMHLQQAQVIETQHPHGSRISIGHASLDLMQDIGHLHQIALEAEAIHRGGHPGLLPQITAHHRDGQQQAGDHATQVPAEIVAP